VVAVVLKPNKPEEYLPGLGSGYCYPWDACHPFPLAVYGKYNSYGGVGEIEKNKITGFIQQVVGKPAEEFFAEAERDREGNCRGDTCLVLIHRDIWRHWEGTDKRYLEVASTARAYSKLSPEKREELVDFVPPWHSDFPMLLFPIEWARSLWGLLLRDPQTAVFKRWWELSQVTMRMSCLRKMWIPPGGGGSQGTNWVEHEKALQVSLKLAQRRARKEARRGY